MLNHIYIKLFYLICLHSLYCFNRVSSQNQNFDKVFEHNQKQISKRSVQPLASIKPNVSSGRMEGVEWITTEWSACDVQCGSKLQTRKVICGKEDGTIFPNEVCDNNRIPETSRNCLELPACVSLWYTSEWSSCSVSCGEGLQTRHVFCGHVNDSGEIVVDDEFECSTEIPQNVSVCKLTKCKGVWFMGPWERCTVPCGGGQKARTVMCLNDNDEIVDDNHCDSSLKPLIKEDCNAHQCDDDQLMAIGGCKDAPNGCCPDGLTAAGNNYNDCPPVNITGGCESTEFGCCKDMITGAFGPFQKGCPIIETTDSSIESTTMVSINETELPDIPSEACIDDGSGEEGSGAGELCLDRTAPAFEIPTTNCSNTTYGCCSDNITAAFGPNFEGCLEGSGEITEETSNITDSTEIISTSTEIFDTTETETETVTNCSNLEFGCCPDNKTPATGPRYYGCTCEQFPSGCCQDRYTPARGPDFDGCICSRMLYGCCNDGVTAATGPNYEGCNCEASSFGCCPDMVTFAKGPNFAECPCDSLTYGCCPGSKTPATGLNFEGCSCANTPFGCCHDGVTVAYGPKFEGCPSGPSLDTKLSTEVCGLLRERGSCRNYTVKWYFDISYGGCNRFWYGGCEGNGNRFSSQEQCERACVTPEGVERCSLPKVSGPCNSSYVAWHYNADRRNCENFLYSGCLGNTNRFETLAKCEQSCVQQETLLDTCEQYPSVGPCRGSYPRWYYRREDGQCKQFVYGGCKGNKNNFQTESECRNACGSQTPQEICALPKSAGVCLGNFPRWYFDNNYGVCKEFTYTGCEGNKNRFVDKAACERLCNQTKVLSFTDNICALPKAEGPCRAAIIQWYFNAETSRCERFYFGGCEGNANRFEDRDGCEKACIARVISQRNICDMPKEAGNCYDYRERWYYETEDKRCHRFYFSGCGGNENNFASFQECYQRCDRQITLSTEPSIIEFKTEFCFKSYDTGPCNRNEIRWFYDKGDGVCKEFLYGGCEGNENRFRSRSECETNCWNSQDICKLANVRGSCSGIFTQWYYDFNANECLEFQFSGCHGNANRFNSKENCETQCKSVISVSTSTTASTILDICHQPYNSGPCRGYFPRWYYSADDNSCKQFIYGGCNGNSNRFEEMSECELRCVTKVTKPVEEVPSETDSAEIICRQQVDSGECRETYARWFYDPESHTCLPFVYGGCGGNKNRFLNYESCIRFCSDIYPPQPQPIDIPSEIKPSETSIECPPSNCDDQRCPFGIDEFVDERGCSACRCSNPCYVHQCPQDMSCAVEVYRAENGEPRAQPVCRLRNKPGYCPQQQKPDSDSLVSPDCVDRCRSDADCRGFDKCCNNGCANVCVKPEGFVEQTTSTTTTASTPRVEFPYESYPSANKQDKIEETELIVIAGNDVSLDCSQSTLYGRYASWSRDGQPLYFVNDKMRILQNSSLYISEISADDAGTYACSIDNAQTKYTRLSVHAPSRILPGPQVVIAQIGLPSQLDCNAVGNPDPTVTWWKGQQMLPLNSIQYRQFSNFTLLIRRVNRNDSGIFTCQAYNGLGPIALWDVTVLIDFNIPEPDIKPYEPYDYDSSFNATILRNKNQYDMNGDNNRTFEVNLLPSLTQSNRSIEPLTTEIRVESAEYTIGSTLQLECIVKGLHSTVSWYFNSDAPLVSDNRHYRIVHNNTLYVYNLSENDSGEYKCKASNQYNDAVASVPINVERVYVPPQCTDSPYFANCDLIVRAKYCINPHYAKFCCRSCLLSGQIDKTKLP